MTHNESGAQDRFKNASKTSAAYESHSSSNVNETNQTKRFASNIGWLVTHLNCCFCFKSYTVTTPNFNKLKEIYQNRIGSNIYFNKDDSILERTRPDDLTKWSNKLLIYLSMSTEIGDHQANKDLMIKHLNTIKSFYKAIHESQNSNQRLDDLFKIIQIYECVMSVGFVVFLDHPETILSINDQLEKAQLIAKKYENRCSSFIINMCSPTITKQMNVILEMVDRNIGEFNLFRVNEHLDRMLEIFCTFNQTRLKSVNRFFNIAELIELVAIRASKHLRIINEEDSKTYKRKKKWQLLALTEKIQTNTTLFEARTPVVRTLVTAFDRFYRSMIVFEEEADVFLFKVNSLRNMNSLPKKSVSSNIKSYDDSIVNVDDKNINKIKFSRNQNSKNDDDDNDNANDDDDRNVGDSIRKMQQQSSKINPVVKNIAQQRDNNNNEKNEYDDLDDKKSEENATGIEFNYVDANKEQNYRTTLNNVKSIGVLFQRLEVILCFLILTFKNQEDLLYPISGHIDECSRIIEKFISLHYLYKMAYGINFLSKLKVIVNRILELLENSHFNFDSPIEFLADFKEKYTDLLQLLYESYLNAKLKAKSEKQSDPIEQALDEALESVLNKLESAEEESSYEDEEENDEQEKDSNRSHESI